jgi:hypothetical protein
MPLTRRGLFALLLAAPLAKWLPKLTPKLPFTPRYYSVSVPISYAEITRTYKECVLPDIRDNFYREDPLYAFLRAHDKTLGRPTEENFRYR